MGLFDSIKNAFGKAVTEAQEAGQTLAEKAGQAVDVAQDLAGDALEKGKVLADQAGDKLSEVATATTEKTSQIVNKIKGDDSAPPQAESLISQTKF